MGSQLEEAEPVEMTELLEREVKLGAWPGFTLPELDEIVPGVRSAPVSIAELDAHYYDTADLRLVRSAITLRHRSVAGEPGEWTVKMSAAADRPGAMQLSDEGALARRELTVRGAADEIPQDIVMLIRAYVRSERLVPVAHLSTVRRSLELRAGSTVVGEVDDDEVSVFEGDRVAARFREVEVEVMAEAGDDLLPTLVARLREAGAGAPDPTPKLVRALGPRALAPPDLAPVDLGDDPTVGDVVRVGITNAVRRVIEHDHVVRLDDDTEGVHQMRVGTRRLRSDLRTFASLLDHGWLQPLRRELGWLADELGAVRDLDVLGARLQHQAASLSRDDHVAAEKVLAVLDEERSDALSGLLEKLESDRYAALLDRLVDAARSPGFDSAGALRPARKMLPKLAARPWRQLEKAVHRLGPDPSAESLHGVRIRAKRARYAADVAVPVIGEPARRYAKAIAALQEALGDFNDAIVAEQWLRKVVHHAAITPEQALVCGQLVARQSMSAETLIGRWSEAWANVQGGKVTAWMS